MSIPNRIDKHLRDQGVAYDLLPHKSTGSTHESASAAHVPADQIAKAVMVRNGGAHAMAVIPGDTWLQLEALNEDAGRVFRLDEEGLLTELLPDCAPGAVPPLGPVYGIETFLDEALTKLSKVYFEAGDHEHLIQVDGADFVGLLPGAHRGKYGQRD